MDSQESLVKNLVMKVKQEIFSSDINIVDVYSLVPPSAYDTAWLAMIPNPQELDEPLFKGCLDWVLQHQNGGGGFWGETSNAPTLDCLTSTLACIVALSTWNVGHVATQKGLAFIHANTETLLEEQNGSFPEWFVIVFPAMVELAETKGLPVRFSNGSTALVEQVFQERQQIFQMQSWWVHRSDNEQQYCSPLLIMQCLEALPGAYNIFRNETLSLLCQSPSAIAYAFMKTGHEEFLANLNSIIETCRVGVPAIYPLDEDLVKIMVINQIETLGLEEHFMEEITSLLGQVYRSYISCGEPQNEAEHVVPLQLYKDSLAFRLLRLHGYTVSPGKFCRFLQDEDIMVYIEEHHEIFLSAMYNVYRATDVSFAGESQLDEARAFSKRFLRKYYSESLVGRISMTNLQDQIKHEISIPWLARLDHLEQRRCIERKENIGPWTGKAFSYRLSCQSNAMLLQLAIENFTLRQSVFRNELTELERWSKDMGFVDMGFARQKTAYCYFAVASTVSHSSLSDVRLALVKSAVLVTVADDFFDKEGSMGELEALANAVKRWQQEGLKGHGKTIFKALKDLVDDISVQFINKNGYDIKTYLQDLWHQTIVSWLKEAEWGRNEEHPSIVEYLQVATSSIASHTILLPAALLLSPPPEIDILKCPQSHPLTNSLMLLTRLLNDIRSYQREQEERKPNLVLLQMKENPNFGVEESIGVIQQKLDDKKEEFLEQVLVNGVSNNNITDMPEAWKQLHLYCLKAFQMFFNSTNAFDSPTELLADINKAFYDPLRVDVLLQGSVPLKSLKTLDLNKKVIKSLGRYGQVGKCLQVECSWVSHSSTTSTCGIKVQGKAFVTQSYKEMFLSPRMRKHSLIPLFPILKPVFLFF